MRVRLLAQTSVHWRRVGVSAEALSGARLLGPILSAAQAPDAPVCPPVPVPPTPGPLCQPWPLRCWLRRIQTVAGIPFRAIAFAVTKNPRPRPRFRRCPHRRPSPKRLRLA